MALKATLIQGGGIGHDQVRAVRHVLEAAGAAIDWEEHVAGMEAIRQEKAPLPPEMLESVRRTRLALKTKLLPSPQAPHTNFNVLLRKTLGLFASVRPLRNLRGLASRFQGVDMLVLRELTEDLYAAIEHEIVPGVVQSLKVVTEAASRRFLRFAFDYARRAGRKSIHCVHKANILKLADGLFLDAFRSVAKDYPELTAREIIVDNCCMQLVSRPQQFDVLVMGNLYGDIVSDLGAGVVGGISATSGINIGDEVEVFETFHGAEREALGADRANPLPLLLPALDLLDAHGERERAAAIRRGVETVLTQGKVRTIDLGGASGTMDMARAIAASLR